MKRRYLSLRTPPGLLLAGLLLAAVAGCNKADPPRGAPRAEPVTLETLVARDVERLLQVTGTVEPTIVAALTSPAEGPIASCRIREGDTVEAGEVLVRIGRQLSVTASVASAREELLNQQREYERVSRLVAEAAVPGSQLDAARAALKRARAALALAEQSAGDYSIRAPWDGVVSRVMVAEGNYVAPRTPLVDLYDPASLVLRFEVPEQSAFMLDAESRLHATFDALPGEEFELRVVRAYPELDRIRRTRTFEAALPDPLAMSPGMFARIRLVLEQHDDALSLPVDAVMQDGDTPFVYVVDAAQEAARRNIELGFEQDGRVLVTGGLAAGDEVIIGGVERVSAGRAVRIRDDRSSEAAQ